jgi:adenosylcobinamide-phosphate synthase
LNRRALLPAAYLLDQIAGDPEWFPHPVRLIGWAIARGEAVLRRPHQGELAELVSGGALTAALVAATYYVTAQIIRQAYRTSGALGGLTETILGCTCLAARNLEREATAVIEALAAGDILLARRRLARIVGRDTGQLDGHEISRAVIETVAESASDGVVAPLVYMALGGVPLAMAYKAVNTLDSMIGHADTRYFYFGKAAARLDDAANYLSARLTSLAIIAASSFLGDGDAQWAWHIWRRDGDKHKSPNAGQPESAMAGALRVRLGGDNTYAGELIRGQSIGGEFPAPTCEHARQAVRVVSVAALLCVGFCALLTAFGQARRSTRRCR